MDPQFFKCNCFYTDNYFLKHFNVHVRFIDRQQLRSDFGDILASRGCVSQEQWERVFAEVEKEFNRRKSLDEDSRTRRDKISKEYVPKYPDLFEFRTSFLTAEFIQLVEECKKENSLTARLRNLLREIIPGKQIYRIPVFSQEFASKFIEEIVYFEQSSFPKGRPNTMNNYGINLDELGFNSLITRLREDYLNHLCRILYPEWVGMSGLDSHKAFTVTYKLGEDEDLDYHYDNAEVTLNFCLGRNFTEGDLYFGNMYTFPVNHSSRIYIPNQPSWGILHRGRHRHGAMPISSGERYNLIIWMRSSSVRKDLCPMCRKKPVLVESDGFSDGFKKINDPSTSQ